MRAGLSSHWDHDPGSGFEKEIVLGALQFAHLFRYFVVGNHLTLEYRGAREMTGAADMSRSEGVSRDRITEAGRPVGSCAASRPCSAGWVASGWVASGWVASWPAGGKSSKGQDALTFVPSGNRDKAEFAKES